MKFGRTYSMLIQGNADDHVIEFPLTCRLKVVTNTLFSLGTAIFQVYNLTSDVRADLFMDYFNPGLYRQVIFSAGYSQDASSASGVELPIIFQGNVIKATSYRQGTDWITEIEALDGGYAIENGTINLTKPSPWNFEDALAAVVKSMPNVKLGTIGTFDLTNFRGITWSGNCWDLITQRVGALSAQAFIRKETVHIVNQWEYITDQGQLDTISEETGMLGTPRTQNLIVTARLIFEPRVEPGQQIALQTLESGLVLPRNGTYKVLQVTHQGTISGAVCENLITDVAMFQPDRFLEAII